MSASEVTQLTPEEERAFQAWLKRSGITDADQPGSFYDYRGYWKEHGDTPIQFGVDHFTDTYKQHGHPTFSVESKYSRGLNDGGQWVTGDTQIGPPMASHARATDRTLAQKWRAKYGSAYDDLTDQQLEALIDKKYPGTYADIPRSATVKEFPTPVTPAVLATLGAVAGTAKVAPAVLSGVGTIAGKLPGGVVKEAVPLMGAYEAYKDVKQGNYGTAAIEGAPAAASIASKMAGPIGRGATWLSRLSGAVALPAMIASSLYDSYQHGQSEAKKLDDPNLSEAQKQIILEELHRAGGF